MESNNKFNRDLTIGYLSLLVKYGNREKFIKCYSSVEPMLLSAIDSTTDKDLLIRLKAIIDYKKEHEMGMSK